MKASLRQLLGFNAATSMAQNMQSKQAFISVELLFRDFQSASLA